MTFSFRSMLVVVVSMLATSSPCVAQSKKAAPTQPVSSTNLPAPQFQSDVRQLEAILDKDEEARVISEKPAPAATAPTSDVVTVEALQIPQQAQDEGVLSAWLTSIRVTAIRWRDALEIIFIAAILGYIRKLYVLSREQQRILSHAIRSAEYAASAAKRSAEICENLLQEHRKPDEAQGKLDLT